MRRLFQDSAGDHHADRPGRLDGKANLSMSRAMELRVAMNRLEGRYLVFVHARCARVYRAIGRILRHRLDKHDRPDRGARALVTRKLCSLLTQLHHLLFQLTFFVGQRVLVLGERRVRLLQAHAGVLNVDDVIHQGQANFSQFDGVSRVDSNAGKVNSPAQTSEGA